MRKILQGALITVLIFISLIPLTNAKAAINSFTIRQGSTDWAFIDDNGAGNGVTGFEVGPGAPPLGTGSFFIQLNSASAGYALTAQKYQGTRLANITQLSYSTYGNQSPQSIAFQINYDPDVTTTEATWYGRLIFEPYHNGSVINNTWQTWDMINGGNARWWASPNAASPVDDACPQSAPCTLANLLAAFPNIGIRNGPLSAILFKAGSGWNGFRGNVDNFVFATAIDTDTYNFEGGVLAVQSHSLTPTYSGVGPNSFTVVFNDDVADPAGNAGANDVTNPANYLLVEAGLNNAFDTVSCAGGVAGDDAQVTVNNATYNSPTHTATVTLNSAVPVGSYRLFICGTTSIVDTFGNRLNGGLSDFIFNFIVNMAPTPTPTPLSTATPPSTATTPLPTIAASLPNTGFAPNKVTTLPIQPAELAYSALGDIWLEIPSLGVKSNIVGVPQSNGNTWNVDWLGADTGWLNGSAFPTWNGNSVLTAHVTDANGLPGPFAAIKDLKYGERIIIHLYGQKYVYEITDSRLSFPSTTGFALQSMQDHSYLTLVTCQGYNPVSESYLFRRLVRAVLIEVK